MRAAPAAVPASAATRLLARAPTAAERAQATALVAGVEQDTQALSRSAFVFRLGREWLAIGSEVVDEVVEPRHVHALPHRREGVVRGVVNVRGQLTVCVALDALLQTGAAAPGGQGPGQTTESARSGVLGRRLVVLADNEQRMAFEADAVHGAHRYADSAVGAVPSTVAHGVSRFSTGVLAWPAGTLGLLDARLLLHALQRRLG
jgi:chemotaxis signal transduction protein